MSLEKIIEEKGKKHKETINKLIKKTEREKYRYKETLDGFYRKILSYFDIEDSLLRKYNLEYIDEKDPYELQHKRLNDVEKLLYELMPVLELAYELVDSYQIRNALEKGELKGQSVVKMVENFLNLHRSGRKKKFYEDDIKEFKRFKEENKEIFNFLEDYKFNIKILDNYSIRKNNLESFLEEYEWRFEDKIQDSSRSTLYRYDKDMYFLKEHIYKLKHAIQELNNKETREYGMEMFKEGLSDRL
jgi:hypothetical protein